MADLKQNRIDDYRRFIIKVFLDDNKTYFTNGAMVADGDIYPIRILYDNIFRFATHKIIILCSGDEPFWKDKIIVFAIRSFIEKRGRSALKIIVKNDPYLWYNIDQGIDISIITDDDYNKIKEVYRDVPDVCLTLWDGKSLRFQYDTQFYASYVSFNDPEVYKFAEGLLKNYLN